MYKYMKQRLMDQKILDAFKMMKKQYKLIQSFWFQFQERKLNINGVL